MLAIRELGSPDIPVLNSFVPPDWNTDLSGTFRRHFGRSYFHPIVARWDGILVGCANALVQGDTGWLGNIIVRPELRGRGIGTALTEELVRILQANRVAHQVLVATPMGEPIYRKLGFQVVSHYVFFARQTPLPSTGTLVSVRPVAPGDESALFALDKAITGETRRAFLRRYLDGAWLHSDSSGRLDGYYLPALGTGLIIAANDDAGLSLLRYKVRHGGDASVVPEQNRAALDFLRAHGFAETSRAPRMVLGSDAHWQPEHVYCRGSGFCG
jgi:GNAT superfamily N-acetyltransferase